MPLVSDLAGSGDESEIVPVLTVSPAPLPMTHSMPWFQIELGQVPRLMPFAKNSAASAGTLNKATATMPDSAKPDAM